MAFNFAQAFNNMFEGKPEPGANGDGMGAPNTGGNGNGNPNPNVNVGTGNNNDPMAGKTGSGSMTNPDASGNGNNNNGNGNAPVVDYTKLFDNEPQVGADGKPIQQDTGYLPKIDPNKISESFGKLKFTDGITPEQRQAMAQGGEAGVAAMMDVIDNVGRSISSRMFSTNYGLMEKALPAAFDKFSGSLDSRINLNMANNMGRSSNPIMSDPSYAPMVDTIRNQISTKYPHLTADNLNTAVTKYFDEMAGKMGYKKEAAPANNGNSNQNNGKKITSDASPGGWEEWIANGAQN